MSQGGIRRVRFEDRRRAVGCCLRGESEEAAHMVCGLCVPVCKKGLTEAYFLLFALQVKQNRARDLSGASGYLCKTQLNYRQHNT